MRCPSRFVAAVCVLWGTLGTLACKPTPGTEAPGDLCDEMMSCFFSNTDPIVGQLGKEYEGLRNSIPEVNRAFDKGGSCWTDDASATECRARCLCLFRELCADDEVRKVMCANGNENYVEEGRCCSHPDLTEHEDALYQDAGIPDAGGLPDAGPPVVKIDANDGCGQPVARLPSQLEFCPVSEDE